MAQLSPFKPSITDVLFSAKTFTAAMLALFVAFFFDLQNPYWAVTTVYVVSNPLSGASTSRAVYRLLGTVFGGIMTVVLVPNLVDSPVMLAIAIALWIGFCLTVGLIDRTPKSYAFILAGYTTALTAFPIVDTPDLAFTNAVARVEEIAVGILCAAIVNRIVFPRAVGPVLAARMDKWVGDASGIIASMLRGERDDPAFAPTIRRLAAEAVDIKSFTIHTAYDTSAHRDLVGLAKTLQRRMVVVLPMISALGDAWGAIATRDIEGTHSASIVELVDTISAWLATRSPLSEEQGRNLRDRLVAMRSYAHLLSPDERRLVEYTAMRSQDLIEIWNDCLLLRQDILSGSVHKLGWRRFGLGSRDWAMHRDYGLAIHSGLSAALATLIAIGFWIASGWEEGGVAAMMAAVLCCIFSATDDPTPAMRGFLTATSLSIAAAFILEFGVLPAVDDFVPLIIILAVFLIPGGCFMARPKTFIQGLGFSMMLPTLMSLKGRPDPNLETFVNGNMAILVGFAIAWATTSVVRSVSVEFAARRLIRAGWRDIASSVSKSRDQNLSHRMIDRIGLIAPRLAAAPANSDLLRVDVLHDLRDAFNVAELMRCRHLLPDSKRLAIANVLKVVGLYYKARLTTNQSRHLPDLAAALDRADAEFADAAANGTAPIESCKVALAGLRYSLLAKHSGNDGQQGDSRDAADRIEQAA